MTTALGGRTAVLASIVVFLGAACGGTPFPSAPTTHVGSPAVGSSTTTRPSPRPPTRPSTRPTTPSTIDLRIPLNLGTTVPTTAPRPNATPEFTLAMLIPSADALGPLWVDDGDPGTSLDRTDPPAACAPFTPIFDGRRATVLHEFSYLPTADGDYEQGHMNVVAILGGSGPSPALELTYVARPSFAACAEASAARRFEETEAGTIDAVSASRVTLGVSGAVLWRATVRSHTAAGTSHTMQMDVGYLGVANVLVKIRVATCGCQPPSFGDAPLMNGETAALQWIAHELAAGATKV